MAKTAVLSDIHGNAAALQTCLRYCIDQGVHRFWFLGDYLGELAYPQKTMALLYALQKRYDCCFIRGNKEDYWFGDMTSWKEYDSTTGALYYTYHQMTEEDFRFFKSLPYDAVFSEEGLPAITLCHGSPRRVNEKLLPNDENTVSVMKDCKADYILCGHTHVQGVICHEGKTVWNPGSVGVPMGSQGKTQFMILSSDKRGEAAKWQCEFVSLFYDTEAVIENLHTSGLYERAPGWCTVSEHLLRAGMHSHGEVLGRAMALCREQTGSCTWPKIPEGCWEQAVQEILR